MITYFYAILVMFNSLNKHLLTIKTTNKKISSSLNHITFTNLYANKNIPTFNNSAMDGYVIKYTNINQNQFTIASELKAGDNVNYKIYNKNCAIEIMTGAKIPKGFNTVIKLEDIQRLTNNIILTKPVKKYSNIRFTGEDFKKNNILIRKCDRINYNTITTLKTFGIDKINIITHPKIFLISTGNEISDTKDNFNKSFLIHNASAPYLLTLFKTLSIDLTYLGLIKDDIHQFLEKLRNILVQHDTTIFITTGAVSKGKYDFIPKTLKKLGIQILFHSVNIKPGKPLLFAKYKTHIYFFCLPGNIISSIIGFRFFIYPFLIYFLKQEFEKPIKAKLLNGLNFKITKQSFYKGYSYLKSGKLYVKILKNQESFKIQPLLHSNCFVFLKKNDIIKKNMFVHIYFYKPLN